MKTLTAALTEPGASLARLFHIDLKAHIKTFLALMEKCPEPKIEDGKLETYNARVLASIRDDMLAHVPDENPHVKKLLRQGWNFLALLVDSDKAWEHYFYEAAVRIKRGDFTPPHNYEPHPENWRP